MVFHRKYEVLWQRCKHEFGRTQQAMCDVAEEQARRAEQVRLDPARRDEYEELTYEGARYASKFDWRRAGMVYREAIALRTNQPEAYFNLALTLFYSGQVVGAAHCFLGAKERLPVGLMP